MKIKLRKCAYFTEYKDLCHRCMQAKGGTGYSNITLILVYCSSSFDINYIADELKIRSIYGVNGKIVKNEQTQT